MLPLTSSSGINAHGGPILPHGNAIMNNSLLNKGTAFTEAERDALGLRGLLPPQVMTIEQQLVRALGNFRRKADALEKYVFLTTLQNRNETLFYRLVQEHAEEMIPIIYTPTVGQACLEYGAIFRRPRGLFISIKDKGRIAEVLRHWPIIDVRMIVVTDGERILGLGDLGALGMGIPVGKLALYTACAGLHPYYTLPITLDVGTDNVALHDDPLYIGLHQKRVRGAEYDEFIEEFVQAVKSAYPKALIQWEDFGNTTAFHILRKYEKQVCSFNDDIQGTAAVVMAAVLSGVKTVGHKLREQRVVIFGAGTAGVGIADLLRDRMVREGLTKDEANRNFWCLGSHGLIHSGLGDQMRDFQRPYARSAEEIKYWTVQDPENIDLIEVVRNVQPTILIGTSARSGAFSEEVVREMAAHCDRPIIMPLSNPTSRAEAVPADIIEWTEGRALVATGSPFKPVDYKGISYEIAQANNALVFPGLGLGVIVSKASRVSDRMIAAAAEAVADMQGVVPRGKSLLPSVNHLRMASGVVAVKVAQSAYKEGLSEIKLEDPVQEVYEAMWQPQYPEILLPEGEWRDFEDDLRARRHAERLAKRRPAAPSVEQGAEGAQPQG